MKSASENRGGKKNEKYRNNPKNERRDWENRCGEKNSVGLFTWRAHGQCVQHGAQPITQEHRSSAANRKARPRDAESVHTAGSTAEQEKKPEEKRYTFFLDHAAVRVSSQVPEKNLFVKT